MPKKMKGTSKESTGQRRKFKEHLRKPKEIRRNTKENIRTP